MHVQNVHHMLTPSTTCHPPPVNDGWRDTVLVSQTALPPSAIHMHTCTTQTKRYEPTAELRLTWNENKIKMTKKKRNNHLNLKSSSTNVSLYTKHPLPNPAYDHSPHPPHPIIPTHINNTTKKTKKKTNMDRQFSQTTHKKTYTQTRMDNSWKVNKQNCKYLGRFL